MAPLQAHPDFAALRVGHLVFDVLRCAHGVHEHVARSVDADLRAPVTQVRFALLRGPALRVLRVVIPTVAVDHGAVGVLVRHLPNNHRIVRVALNELDQNVVAIQICDRSRIALETPPFREHPQPQGLTTEGPGGRRRRPGLCVIDACWTHDRDIG